MTKVYKGFGETLPTQPADRLRALQGLIKRREEKAEALHEKIKKGYVEPEGTSETERGQDSQE